MRDTLISETADDTLGNREVALSKVVMNVARRRDSTTSAAFDGPARLERLAMWWTARGRA